MTCRQVKNEMDVHCVGAYINYLEDLAACLPSWCRLTRSTSSPLYPGVDISLSFSNLQNVTINIWLGILSDPVDAGNFHMLAEQINAPLHFDTVTIKICVEEKDMFLFNVWQIHHRILDCRRIIKGILRDEELAVSAEEVPSIPLHVPHYVYDLTSLGILTHETFISGWTRNLLPLVEPPKLHKQDYQSRMELLYDCQNSFNLDFSPCPLAIVWMREGNEAETIKAQEWVDGILKKNKHFRLEPVKSMEVFTPLAFCAARSSN